MPRDLYTILARSAEPDDERNPHPRPDKRSPHTVLTHAIETIDNDRASYLLGTITI